MSEMSKIVCTMSFSILCYRVHTQFHCHCVIAQLSLCQAPKISLYADGGDYDDDGDDDDDDDDDNVDDDDDAGNACQLYPKVISFYSEPPHAIACPEITINIANNTNMVSFLVFVLDLVWFLMFFGYFGEQTKPNSEPPQVIACAEITINIANITNMVWFGFCCFSLYLAWFWFGLVNFCLNVCERNIRQNHSHCMPSGNF